jgi:hypothetical protein
VHAGRSRLGVLGDVGECLGQDEEGGGAMPASSRSGTSTSSSTGIGARRDDELTLASVGDCGSFDSGDRDAR